MRKTLPILFVLTTFSSVAQTRPDTTILIENVFSRYLPQNPGCQFAVSRNGSLVFSKAWGTSNLEDNIPLTTLSIMEAGSVSKQFTAAAILLLEQQGKLSIDDDVRKYIPELPPYGHVIRLKHLIHHTSGIKDWGSIAELTGWERGTKTYSNQDALEIITQQKTLNNIPGAEFIYSNSNYNLLAIVVQRASGTSLANFTQKYILTPAGMTQSQWRDNFKRIVPNRAIAYQRLDSAFEADMPFENAYGNGGLLTTADDLIKWNDFYLSGKFGSPSLMQKQISTDLFNNEVTNYYGAGLFIQKHSGLSVIRHSGATASYRCYLEYYPQLGLSLAWLSNTSQFDNADFDVINEVEKIFIKSTPGTFPEKETKMIVSLEKLKTYEGWYRNSSTNNGIQILLKDKVLVVDNRIPLVPVKKDAFKMGDNLLVFEKSNAFKMTNEDKDTTNYTPVLSASLTSPMLKEYNGVYFSDETKSGITVSQKEDHLTIFFKSDNSYALQPTYKDAFRIMQFGGTINFERDEKNNIVRLKISQSRARNVEFTKMK